MEELKIGKDFLRSTARACVSVTLTVGVSAVSQAEPAPTSPSATNEPACLPAAFIVDSASGKTDTQISGRLKRFVTPTYPPAELAAGTGSAVRVTAKISALGEVTAVSRLNAQPESAAFEAAVGAVVKHWKFVEPLGCDCAPKDNDEASVVVQFEIEDGKPKISLAHKAHLPNSTVVDPRFAGAKFSVLNHAAVRRDFEYPIAARREGAQANTYAKLLFDTSTGRVAKVTVSKVITAKDFEGLFTQATEDSLRRYRIAPISDKPALLAVCIPVTFRLTR